MALSDKYELIRPLGHGAGGSVYLVRHRALNVFRAVKIISKKSSDAQRILNEALIIRDLKHQGIPIVYDIDETFEEYHIYEEYVEGTTLSGHLQNSALSLTDILRMSIDLCSILSFLHHCGKGILHLDLKPDNIMIDVSGKLWLIDYDNAALQGDVLPACRGSAGFSPPQQYFGSVPKKSWDIYSLGMLILYMSEGTIHSGISHMRHKQLIPIIRKCVHHSGLNRYRSVDALQKDLQNVLKERPEAREADISDFLVFDVCGTDRGVGTTHFCLCLCSFLNRHGICSAISDCSGTGSYSLIRANAVSTPGNRPEANYSNGVFKNGNLYLFAGKSFFNNASSFGNFRVIIRDFGNKELPKPDMQDSVNTCIIKVCCFGKPFNEINNICHDSNQKHPFIIWNLCSAAFFYQQTRHIPLSCYRMPCVYDFDMGSPLCDTMLYELIIDMDCGLAIAPPESMRKGGRHKRIIACLRHVAEKSSVFRSWQR